MSAARLSVVGVVVLGCALIAQQQAPPRFQSSVEVTSVDVSVVDDNGRPIRELTPADFVVRVDNSVRRVVSAEWVSLGGGSDAPDHVASVPPGYSSNENATNGRLVVLAIDQPNIRFGHMGGLLTAVGGFIDRLSASDRVAAVGFGIGGHATPFSGDHELIKQAVSKMMGQRQTRIMPIHNIAVSEAVRMSQGDFIALQQVLFRECGEITVPQLLVFCQGEVQAEAESMAQDALDETDQTLRDLRALLVALRGYDSAKTLVIVSEGFVLRDPILVNEMGALAAAARTSIYVLKLDSQMFDITDRRAPTAPFEDRRLRADGLETLAGAARGAIFTITGTGSSVFQRIESEISGYYLLGVESETQDHDGKPHQVRVEVSRRGAIVRSRRQILDVNADRIRPPREAVLAALSTPLLMSALPVRVATFALGGVDRGRVQVLIHADIGTEYTAPRPVSVGFVVLDRDGRMVATRMASEDRIEPIVQGVPSPLQFTASASLPPGEYTLKFVAAEGARVGSVQHSIRAALVDAGEVTFSELMAGGPVDSDVPLRPTISYTVSYGALHGYVEAYGSELDALSVKYEVAPQSDGPALIAADVRGRAVNDGRMLFSAALPVRALPPGRYVLRALVSRGGAPLATLTRDFEVAAPAVLMASAESNGAGDAALELFLPTEENAFASSFNKTEAIDAKVVEPFRALVPSEAKPTFEAGLASLATGDLRNAESSFKRGIQPEFDATPSLVYLAVCFAASGKDTEAASAWQTALIDGADNPQIYVWLGQALLRTHSLGEARTLLEEAVERWPSDGRFSRPLAQLYATFGKGRDAVRMLQRYLADHPSDTDAVYLGVQWIYHVHLAGAVVRTQAEDAKAARALGEAYQKAAGPKTALVRQWVDFIQRSR